MRLSAWMALAIGMGLPPATAAQDSSEDDLSELTGLARETEEVGILDAVKVRFKLKSDFAVDGDFGDFSADVYSPEARLRVTVPLTETIGMRFIASGGSTVFDFDDSDDLFGLGPSSDPFDPLQMVTLRIQAASIYDPGWSLFSDDERWSLLGEGVWKSRWESGADFSSGIRGGGTLAVGYQLPKRLELALGVQVSSKLLGSGVSVSPVVEFRWIINDRWTVRNRGAGAQLEYKLHDDLTLFASGRLESHSYRLDDRDGSIGKGKIRVRRVPTMLGIRWDALPQLRVTAGAGVMAWQQLRIEDRDGDELSDPSAGPAPYFLLGFEFRP